MLRTRPKVERILVSDPMFAEVAKMRYRVYCEDMGFLEKEKYPNHQEMDEYDGQAIHVVVTIGKRLVGYARVILPNSHGLPIFKYFDIPKEKDLDNSCEISRFMISRLYRKKQETRRAIFKLLAEEIQRITKETEVKVIYAVIEEWLLKSLNKRGFDFKLVGEGRDYMGAITYPVKLDLA